MRATSELRGKPKTLRVMRGKERKRKERFFLLPRNHCIKIIGLSHDFLGIGWMPNDYVLSSLLSYWKNLQITK